MLGAYCGDVSSTPPADVKAAFSALFGHAAQHGLDVDLHIDETNNPECCAMLPLCESLQEARESGYRGHIALSHVTSLALQGADCRDAIIGSLSELAPLTVVSASQLWMHSRRLSYMLLHGLPMADGLFDEFSQVPLNKFAHLAVSRPLACQGQPYPAAVTWHPHRYVAPTPTSTYKTDAAQCPPSAKPSRPRSPGRPCGGGSRLCKSFVPQE